jgi:hypothetical protein
MTTQSNTQLPEYEYVPIGEYTLVRINTFLRTETFVDEETKSESIMYVYEVNEIKFKANEITEEMVKNNIDYYRNYTETEFSVEDKINAMEEVLDFLLMRG